MGDIIAKFDHKLPDGEFRLTVDVAMPARGISVIFGRSGSGKTTLLRCLAGLDCADEGLVQISDQIWQNNQQFVPTYKRKIGYVFQSANLFDHLTVMKNLAFAQKRARGNKGIKLDHIVDLLDIEKLFSQYPAQLSGGEKQRVAIARALLTQPDIILMDEPLASLDYERKQDILPYLEHLRNEFDIPVVYVTHSIEEAARLADYFIWLDEGQIVAQGSLSEILPKLDLPVSFGEDMGAVIDATIVEKDPKWHLNRATFNGGELWIVDDGDAIGGKIRMHILARDVSIMLQPHENKTSILNALQAEITDIAPDKHAAMQLVQVQLGETLLVSRITAKSSAQLGLKIGDDVWLNIKSVSIIR